MMLAALLVGPDGRVFLAIYEFDGAKLRYIYQAAGRLPSRGTTGT
jgi:hypothetical protein